MTSGVPGHVHECINDLEAQAREYEGLAQRCREAVATVRQIYGVRHLVAATPEEPSMPAKPRRAAAGKASPKGGAERKSPAIPRQRMPSEAVQARVMACLEQTGRRMKVRDIQRAVELDELRVRAALKALHAAGRIERSGKTTATVYSAGSPADADTPPPASPSPATPVSVDAVRGAIEALLSSGASYSPIEVLRHLRRSIPDIDATSVESAITALIQKGRVTKLQTDAGTRWRKAAKAS